MKLINILLFLYILFYVCVLFGVKVLYLIGILFYLFKWISDRKKISIELSVKLNGEKTDIDLR